MLTLTKLNHQLAFPDTNLALNEPNGLLAFGGDLSPKRLLLAYSSGIFPWFSQDEPIMWWSPDPRGILSIPSFKPSKSLKKFARTCDYKISVNLAFSQVIDVCATIPRDESGTWITDEMIQAYKALHHLGHGHSIEVWDGETLVGGLYGVMVGKVFCGESMFHRATNASKLAILYLVELMKTQSAQFIDCQMQNPHLASLGCIEMARSEFMLLLKQQTQLTCEPNVWQPRYLEKIT